MANALKCDRCGICFDPLRIGKTFITRFRNPVLQNEQNKKEGTIGELMLVNEPADAFVDLCPACTLDFQMFMRADKYKEWLENDAHM